MLKTIVAFLFAASSAFAVSETVEGAKKDFEKFKKEMSIKLDEAEKELKELRADAKERRVEVQERTIRDLERTREKLSSELNTMSDKSKTKWVEFKEDMAAAVNDLNVRIQEILGAEEEGEATE